uniref:Uncharacterized protein n=1 Tax=Picea glauca TaxID=3330 RepID=A0A101LYW2_PICGL|nr:hypothetical protein ABT39_MTgene4886 [Picea glauca]QHR92351.1 hypothetical protein Q903MT_gene6393 [Picea sitchensis]
MMLDARWTNRERFMHCCWPVSYAARYMSPELLSPKVCIDRERYMICSFPVSVTSFLSFLF